MEDHSFRHLNETIRGSDANGAKLRSGSCQSIEAPRSAGCEIGPAHGQSPGFSVFKFWSPERGNGTYLGFYRSGRQIEAPKVLK